MATAYYSVVLRHIADAVSAQIRSVGAYASIGVTSETMIGNGTSGDQVGAIARVATGAAEISQRLLAFSNMNNSYSWELVDPRRFP